jgi:signal transduction histidine kinase
MIRRWLARAFGPASVSAPAMALVAPLGIILGATIGLPDIATTPEVWAWSALGQGVFTIVAFSLPRLIRASQPLARATCVAIAGALRGTILTLGFVSLDLVSPTAAEFGLRSLHSAVASVLWVAFCGVLLQGGRDFRTSYRLLVAESMTLQSAAINGEVPPGVLLRWTEISRALAQTSQRAQALIAVPDPSGKDLRAAADVIHAAIEDDLRPESRTIWRSSTLDPPRLRWKELLLATLTPWNPPIGLTLAVYGALLTFGSVARLGYGLGLGFAVLLLLETWALLVLSRTPAHQVAVGLVTLLLMPAVVFGISTFVGQVLVNAPLDRGGIALAALSGSLCCWTVSIYQRLSHERQILLDALQARIDAQALSIVGDRRHYELLQAELGAFVHHSLSSEMTALHVHLSQAAETPDEEVREAARMTAHQRLRSLETIAPPWASRSTGREHIAEVALAWQGIADVSVDLAPEGSTRSEQWSLAALIVEEAVAGSVRGGARAIEVRASVDGDDLHLSVVDDGRGLPAEVSPGLGTAWLDHYCPGAWSRSNLPQGARLDVRIA